jgi:hypothetical protein
VEAEEARSAMEISPPKMAAINAIGIKHLYFMLVPSPKDFGL